MPDDLQELHDALTRDLRVPFDPKDGIAAFERHQLLAVRFTRASRLNAPASLKQDGERWRRYFDEHFPRAAHADLLWTDWRTPLLKDEAPGDGVAICHGFPDAHWQRASVAGEEHERLVVDLESMWTDYEASIAHFIDTCRGESDRRDRAVRRWGKRQWEVQVLRYVSPSGFALMPVAASATTNSTILVLQDRAGGDPNAER